MHTEKSILGDELHTLARSWIQALGEIFTVICYANNGGLKDYYIFDNLSSYEALVQQLPYMADVIIFRQKQLPYRGIADERLKELVKPLWTMEDEWTMAKLHYNEPLIRDGWWDDATEIDRVFNDLCGKFVCVGSTPTWWKGDNEEMQSGLVPLADGSLKRGAY